ncbi:hypothetical protein SDC9_77082 [bioreactor metagenome]|uniref:Uncharacterized protein n=1 Tax=bioreactor metagenome TaxID=1076179 RepID=A0A644YPH8_9ZZZZ
MEVLITSLSTACRSRQGIIGLLLQDGTVPSFQIVCTDRSAPAIAAERLAIAQSAGTLLSCRAASSMSLSCLYGEAPHRIDLVIIGASEFRGVRTDEQIVWEWNSALSAAVPTPDVPDLKVLLRASENNFWLLQFEVAKWAAAGELLQAVDTAAKIRRLYLTPLFQAAHLHPSALEATVPACDIRSIYNALVAAGENYFALRYELADDDFVRREEAELLAGEAMEALQAEIRRKSAAFRGDNTPDETVQALY